MVEVDVEMVVAMIAAYGSSFFYFSVAVTHLAATAVAADAILAVNITKGGRALHDLLYIFSQFLSYILIT